MRRSVLKTVVEADSEILTTLDAVKEELRITNTASDPRLTRLIKQASALCAGHCATHFGKTSVVETFFQGTKSDRLVLQRGAIVRLESVVEGDQELVVDTDYVVEAEAGMLVRLLGDARGWWSGEQWNFGLRFGWVQPKIVVTYQAGYDLPDKVPPDLERAAIEVIKDLWYRARDEAIVQVNVPGVVERRYSASRGDTSGEASLSSIVTDMLLPFHRGLT